jgi:hypothetical protein
VIEFRLFQLPDVRAPHRLVVSLCPSAPECLPAKHRPWRAHHFSLRRFRRERNIKSPMTVAQQFVGRGGDGLRAAGRENRHHRHSPEYVAPSCGGLEASTRSAARPSKSLSGSGLIVDPESNSVRVSEIEFRQGSAANALRRNADKRPSCRA